jgi:hypothetical protein
MNKVPLDAQTIFAEALALPPDMREKLADQLWQSLDGAYQQEVQAEWAEKSAGESSPWRREK